MKIAGREIGPGHPPYVVAELSGEHRGMESHAHLLVRAAAKAGADAVKLQCFDPLRLAHRRGAGDRTKQITEGLWKGRTLLDLYLETYTPRDWFPELFDAAKARRITLFASVFDVEDVDLMERFDCPAYKISAYEFKDEALIRKVASTRKPMIMSVPSTASQGDIAGAQIAAANLNENIAYLHCVSEYPADDARLERLSELQATLGQRWVVGFSDHTLGIDAAIKAAKMGACIIEKHVTLSRADGGPDAAFSLEPDELTKLVSELRRTS